MNDAQKAKERLDAKMERIFGWILAVAIVACLAVVLVEILYP